MSGCTKGVRSSYDAGMAIAVREERIAQLESRNRSLVEYDTNVRQHEITRLTKENDVLRKQLDAERDIRARKSNRIAFLDEQNKELRELAKFLYCELAKDVTFVDADGNESMAPWGEEYMEPIRGRMVALGVSVDAYGMEDE